MRQFSSPVATLSHSSPPVSKPRNARRIASCTRSSASAGECDNQRAKRYAAFRCGNTSASNRPRCSSMDATECNPHGAQPTLTYEARLTEYPLYSLTESRGLLSPVAPFPQTGVGDHAEAGRRRVRQGCGPLRTTWPGRRREALVLVKGLEAGMPLNVRSRRITVWTVVVDSELPCTPVRRGGTALALFVCDRGCGVGMKSVVDARQAAHLSRCPSGPVLQNLANLSLGENLERPVACSRHAFMLKETRQRWSRPAPSSDVGQGIRANAKL